MQFWRKWLGSLTAGEIVFGWGLVRIGFDRRDQPAEEKSAMGFFVDSPNDEDD